MFQAVILIPVADNDNVVFTASHHAQFESYVVDLFGGITRYGSDWASASCCRCCRS